MLTWFFSVGVFLDLNWDFNGNECFNLKNFLVFGSKHMYLIIGSRFFPTDTHSLFILIEQK